MNSAGRPDFLSYQQDFITWLTALDERNAWDCAVAALLKDDCVYRLSAYQGSYLGRVTKNLSETLFEPCEKIFGKDEVFRVLASFFKLHPPSTDSLTDAALALPSFIRAQQVRPEVLLFADLVEVSLIRWRLLTGDDPSEKRLDVAAPLSNVFLLSTAHYIHPTGHHDLGRTWQVSTGAEAMLPNADVWQEILAEKVGVILAKTSPTMLSVVSVPPALVSFVTALIEGHSVEDAIEALDDKQYSSLPFLLNEFLSKIASLGMLKDT